MPPWNAYHTNNHILNELIQCGVGYIRIRTYFALGKFCLGYFPVQLLHIEQGRQSSTQSTVVNEEKQT